MKADIERASQIVKDIYNSYNKKEWVFANLMNVEESFPETMKDEKEKALFTFYMVALDYAMKSTILYDGARRLYKEKPEFFNPEFLEKQNVENLSKILREYLKPRYPNEAAKRWISISKLLLEKYQGDPRKIFERVDDSIEVMNRIREFRGFGGQKIGNLFFRVMLNLGYGKRLKNVEKITLPIDTHDIRLTKDLGISDTKDIDQIKQIWSKACKKAGISWLVLDKALWQIGSQGCNYKKCKECIISKYCSKVIK